MNTLKPSRSAAPPAAIKFNRGVVTVRDRGLVPWGGFSVFQNIKKWSPGISKRLGCELFVFSPGDESPIQSFYPRIYTSLYADRAHWADARASVNYDAEDSALNLGSYDMSSFWRINRIFLLFDMRHYDGVYPGEDFFVKIFPDSPIDTDVILQAVNITLDDYNPDFDDTLPASIFSSLGEAIVDTKVNLQGLPPISFSLNHNGINFFAEKIRSREIAVVCLSEYNADYLDVNPAPPEWRDGTGDDYWDPKIGSWDDGDGKWSSGDLADGVDVIGVVGGSTGLPSSPSVGDRYLVSEDTGGFNAGEIIEWDGNEWVSETPPAGTVVTDVSSNNTYVSTGDEWVEVGDDIDEDSSMLLIDVSDNEWEDSFRPSEVKIEYSCDGCDPSSIRVIVYDKDGNEIAVADAYTSGDEIVVVFNGDVSINDIGRIVVTDSDGSDFYVHEIKWLAYDDPFLPPCTQTIDDSFSGVNGSLPATDRWVANNGPFYIESNKLRVGLNYNSTILRSSFTINGPFDISADFIIQSKDTSNGWGISIEAPGVKIYTNPNYNPANTDLIGVINGHYASITNIPPITGVRMWYDGTTFGTNYNIGSGWQPWKTSTGTLLPGPVEIGGYSDHNLPINNSVVYIDNFKWENQSNTVAWNVCPRPTHEPDIVVAPQPSTMSLYRNNPIYRHEGFSWIQKNDYSPDYTWNNNSKTLDITVDGNRYAYLIANEYQPSGGYKYYCLKIDTDASNAVVDSYEISYTSYPQRAPLTCAWDRVNHNMVAVAKSASGYDGLIRIYNGFGSGVITEKYLPHSIYLPTTGLSSIAMDGDRLVTMSYYSSQTYVHLIDISGSPSVISETIYPHHGFGIDIFDGEVFLLTDSKIVYWYDDFTTNLKYTSVMIEDAGKLAIWD